MVMKIFIFLLFLILTVLGMHMGDMIAIVLSMMGFLFTWALMDEDDVDT